jgi:hypothetical protein
MRVRKHPANSELEDGDVGRLLLAISRFATMSLPDTQGFHARWFPVVVVRQIITVHLLAISGIYTCTYNGRRPCNLGFPSRTSPNSDAPFETAAGNVGTYAKVGAGVVPLLCDVTGLVVVIGAGRPQLCELGLARHDTLNGRNWSCGSLGHSVISNLLQ